MVLPLLKNGDPSIPDNYRPISRLSVTAKIFEPLVNEQIKRYLSEYGILTLTQSGFRQCYSTITATTLVTNYIITALDNKKSCGTLFVDLSRLSF